MLILDSLTAEHLTSVDLTEKGEGRSNPKVSTSHHPIVCIMRMRDA